MFTRHLVAHHDHVGKFPEHLVHREIQRDTGNSERERQRERERERERETCDLVGECVSE